MTKLLIYSAGRSIHEQRPKLYIWHESRLPIGGDDTQISSVVILNLKSIRVKKAMTKYNK
jgi:hypothetical protein